MPTFQDSFLNPRQGNSDRVDLQKEKVHLLSPLLELLNQPQVDSTRQARLESESNSSMRKKSDFAQHQPASAHCPQPPVRPVHTV
jgi:hypothetical protein